MNKLAKLIEHMDEEDLIKIRRDLISGNIDRLIRMRLDTQIHEKLSDKICPVCGGEITNESFVLEFGASYLRRKARFDGVDCLEYFVSTKLKNNRNAHSNSDNEHKNDSDDTPFGI